MVKEFRNRFGESPYGDRYIGPQDFTINEAKKQVKLESVDKRTNRIMYEHFKNHFGESHFGERNFNQNVNLKARCAAVEEYF